MKKKLLIFLFFGILSTFIGEMKAEDIEICEYSNPSEFAICKRKNNVKVIPKFPVKTFDRRSGELWVGTVSSYRQIINFGTIFRIAKLSAINENKLELTLGNKEVGFWGWKKGDDFISSETFEINPKDIILWKYYYDSKIVDTGFDHLIYKVELKYLDQFGNIKIFKANRSWAKLWPRRVNIIPNILSKTSKLKNGEERDIKETLFTKLKRNEKNLIIIKSIINVENNQNKNCINDDESKFPELTKRYKKIYPTINPLRAKLDLPQSDDIKPICNLKNSI